MNQNLIQSPERIWMHIIRFKTCLWILSLKNTIYQNPPLLMACHNVNSWRVSLYFLFDKEWLNYRIER